MNISTFSEVFFNKMLSSGVSEHFSMSGDGNGVFFQLTNAITQYYFSEYPLRSDYYYYYFFLVSQKSLSIQINLSQYSCVKRSLIASSSHENLNYNTTTKLHLFKHAINPQKCFIFSYRPQTRSNNIWPIPAERRQCCLLFSLELQNSRE